MPCSYFFLNYLIFLSPASRVGRGTEWEGIGLTLRGQLELVLILENEENFSKLRRAAFCMSAVILMLVFRASLQVLQVIMLANYFWELPSLV